MNLLAAFLKLIRFSNLVFIAATQVLYYYGIMVPIGESIPGAHMRTSPDIFWLVVAASVLDGRCQCTGWGCRVSASMGLSP